MERYFIVETKKDIVMEPLLFHVIGKGSLIVVSQSEPNSEEYRIVNSTIYNDNTQKISAVDVKIVKELK